MTLRIATWNINSVRLRIEQVARFVDEAKVDVLCLQEIKCLEDQFPRNAFVDMGMPHLKVAGQKGWHGVAIASRLPIEPSETFQACKLGHARCVSARIAGIDVQNFYIPAGGDEPDRELNPKFDHKMDFYEQLTRTVATQDRSARLLMCGDFNIAPSPFDVWNHKYMSRIVSHTPLEVETLNRLQAAGGFADVVRDRYPEPETLASVVELSGQGFPRLGAGSAAGPYLDLAGPDARRRAGLGDHPRAGAGLGTTQRPLPHHGRPGRLTPQ